MSAHLQITSPHNPHIKRLIALHKKRERDRTGLFLVEGLREIQRTRGIEAIYYTEWHPWMEEKEREGAQLIEILPDLLSKVSYREAGAVAVVKQPTWKMEEVASGTLFLVLEALEKPGNIGALMRTADAVGVDALFIVDEVTDLFNPNVVRGSLGVITKLPTFRLAASEVIAFFKERGVSIVATMPEAKQFYYDIDMRGALAVAVGSESSGLSPIWSEEGVVAARIPMLGIADSLNAGVAGAIVLYEALRQRNCLR